MLKLEFKDFQDKMQKDQVVDHYATVHCMIDEAGFTFVMKSREKWNYYTVMTFDLILRYATEEGLDPTEAFDMFMINYCSNTLKILPPEKEEILDEIKEPIIEDDIPNEEISKSRDRSGSKRASTFTTPIVKNEVVDAGNDFLIEAEDYSDFLLKFFNTLEKRVILSLKNLEDELDKSITQKTFGEFLSNMFNVVNTAFFLKQVRRYLKQDLLAGLESSEEELSMNFGFSDAHQQRLNQLAFQQMEGYSINGRIWPGIKGVTKEIQASVVQTVQAGINENISLAELKTKIKDDFGFSESRSAIIARTETNRVLNEGKLLGYIDSGLDGKKVWTAAQPRGCPNCSPICDRLDGQEVGLYEDFVDPETFKHYSAPPGHPYCKSTIFFKPN